MTSSYSRIRGTLFGVAWLIAAAACDTDGVTNPTNDDAARAVNVFTHLADSVSRNGGDAEMGGAYASLAEAVRAGGRVSTIVITVDGAPTTFYAIATLNDVSLAPCAVGFCTMDKKPQSLQRSQRRRHRPAFRSQLRLRNREVSAFTSTHSDQWLPFTQ